ncbi:helix-turn-helix domain-containing protein [Streptomyces sp. NPDC019990]|uniref:helix-turn-helix domain-containing protein n=1 Tax=Streptomyces sp. NPDC019990 TaxID=3154693 RepID=UPI0033CDFE62
MPAQNEADDVREFAAQLRALKDRTDRSYGSLARRLAMNTSTLHRYCAGEAVPLDFAPVERFAALCGASPKERLELHRRWLLAVATRQRRTAGPGGAGAEGVGSAASTTEGTAPVPARDAGPVAAGTGGTAGQGPETAAAARRGPASRPAPGQPPPAHRPWYRGRRVAVGLAAACAVLATLGSLSALPDGQRPTAGRAPTAEPAAFGTPDADAEAEAEAPGHDASTPTSPSNSPPKDRPSPSAPRKEKPSATPSAVPSAPAMTPPTGGKTPDAPLTWSVNSQAWKLGCGHDYVVSKPPRQVPPPPVPQDAGSWAASQGAVHGGETVVELSVQGRTDTAVVLQALRVRVVGRTAPAQGNAYAMDNGCGGSLTPRYFDVNLDKDRPLAHAVPGSDAGTPVPAVRMPYRVSARDPEVLLVTARTATCDCRWYLELDWSSQGRRGTVRVDDDGRPFRTSGIKGLPRYAYDTSARQWAPYR